MLKPLLTLLLILISLTTLRAQNGTITGKVVDEETGEELIGVNVLIEGTTMGSSTDLSGVYNISIEPGTYNIVATYISYTNQTIQGVEVQPGKVTEINIALGTGSIQLE
ncbi:MAG: carboxypeptidase-like regulatory domain-containing protein, partial [Catalinimonas sp.]